MEKGGHNGRTDLTSTFDDFCRKAKGIVRIENEDQLCLARALVVGIARAQMDLSPLHKTRYNSIRMPNRKMQKTEAEKLCQDAGVNLQNGGGVEELILFQKYLDKFTITVFNDRRGRSVMFEGTNGANRKNIDLIFENGHFNTIISLTAAFHTKMYCRPCKVPYEHVGKHRCPLKCNACFHDSPCQSVKDRKIECPTCKRLFKTQDCLENHRQPLYSKKRSVCDVLKFCTACKKVYSVLMREGNHVCGESYCSTCDCYRPAGHLCYMTKDKRKAEDDKAKFLYVFFDFECSQDSPEENRIDSFIHQPNFCVLQQVCYSCVGDPDMNNNCAECGERQQIFKGKETLDKFMAYITRPRPQFKKIILLAHNMKSYDGQFLLNRMTQHMKWTPEVIMNGSKIQVIKYSNETVLDSLNFFNCKLSDLPGMFGLECEEKGHFPHFFNREENWAYVGELPPKEDYGCNTMKTGERESFMQWYDELQNTNHVFNFQAELQRYCIQDVEILRLACLRFREIFLKETQIDPFLNSVTIASTCMLTYRKLFIKPDTIGIVPQNGYRLRDRQSAVALQWLRWMEHSRGINIKHAGNGRETRVGNYKVDGFYHNDETGETTVFEFHGCWWHGCDRCHKDRFTPIPNSPHETMDSRYEGTVRRVQEIKNSGHEVIEMWECQFTALKARDPEVKAFLETEDEDSKIPLNPRHAFYGGRTNCTKLYHEVTGEEKIRYFDVCSLYPYVCKYSKMPVGHPEVLFGVACPQDITGVEGLIKATVLPPQNLYHPVLPVRLHKKLMFPLCRTCAEEQAQVDCEHDDRERRFTGTWVSDELHKAVAMGYKVIKVYEIWRYETTQYVPEPVPSANGGLFNEYIDKFLKMKVESSGWPVWCRTEEDKQKYLRDYETHEGIKLELAKINKNKGLRSLAKMMLNSFWGKFGQRDNFLQTKFVNTHDELTDLLTKPGVEVNDIIPLSQDCLLANWHYQDDAISVSSRASVPIAAYVTTAARLKLYSYLEMLGNRVLYFDTDSVIFVDKPGFKSLKTGDYLGDLTDELEEYGPGSFIDCFVSGGPKHYGYRVRVRGGADFKYTCKVKGINLNYQNSQVVNFDKMKSMVLSPSPSTVVLTGKSICRTKEMQLVTRPEKKTIRVVYDKRRRVDNYKTVPFGFKFPN